MAASAGDPDLIRTALQRGDCNVAELSSNRFNGFEADFVALDLET